MMEFVTFVVLEVGEAPPVSLTSPFSKRVSSVLKGDGGRLDPNSNFSGNDIVTNPEESNEFGLLYTKRRGIWWKPTTVISLIK